MLLVPNNSKLNMTDVSAMVKKLPAIPQVAVKVSRMLGDFNVSIEQLSDSIMLDQSLTAQLLKLCNSAHYGFSRKIVSVKDAVAKLGLNTVKCLVFVAVSQGVLDSEVTGYSLARGQLWKNSITCAYYAKYLAEIFNYRDQDLAFIAGLLRDIGKLIMSEYVGINYNKIIRLVDVAQVSFTTAEEMCVGYNHAQIGAEILNYWNFPTVLVETVKYHHDFINAYSQYNDLLEDPKLIGILHLADAFTIMLGESIGADGLMYPIDDKAFDLINDSDSPVNVDLIIEQLVDLSSEIDSMVKVLR